MTTPEMHAWFRQYAQQMGMQNVRAILPEQIDNIIYTSSLDIVDEIVRTNFGAVNDRVITDNVKLGNINSLRTLYKVKNIDIESEHVSDYKHRPFSFDSNDLDNPLYFVDFAIQYSNVSYASIKDAKETLNIALATKNSAEQAKEQALQDKQTAENTRDIILARENNIEAGIVDIENSDDYYAVFPVPVSEFKVSPDDYYDEPGDGDNDFFKLDVGTVGNRVYDVYVSLYNANSPTEKITNDYSTALTSVIIPSSAVLGDDLCEECYRGCVVLNDVYDKLHELQTNTIAQYTEANTAAQTANRLYTEAEATYNDAVANYNVAKTAYDTVRAEYDKNVTRLFPIRVIDDSKLADTLNDYVMSPRMRSPIMVIYNADAILDSNNTETISKFDIYVGDNLEESIRSIAETMYIHSVRCSYIKKPAKVRYVSDIVGDFNMNINSDLPEQLQIPMLKHAVDLYRISIQGSLYANQQNAQQNQQELARNNVRPDNDGYQS